MMKQFFTSVLGSFVGVLVALFVFSVMSIVSSMIVFGALMSKSSDNIAVQDNSILHITLSGSLPERTNDNDVFSSLMSDDNKSYSLDCILKAIKVAKDNDKIKGIYIECENVHGGTASLYEIRRALNDFKSSKKFIYAYGNSGISQSDYYVASVADSIFLNPVGAVDIHGLSSVVPYYKALLDKVGIEMQVVRVGAFKSAVEPYIATEASDASKLQRIVYLHSMWMCMSKEMSASRKISVDKFNLLADSITMTQSAEYLLANKLVDKICYRYELENRLKQLTDVDSKDDLRLVTPDNVAALDKSSSKGKDVVAVVYAEGEIDGSDSASGIDSEQLSATIIELANDDDVKAVVLRVNSPGGSAFGAEQIWAALEQVKKAGKPFAVSMGDYAASGGYYISCGADHIFAEPVTITGSIGIYGMIPCVKGLVQDKLGITQSVINTNANGNFISISEPMTPFQYASMQKNVNRGYELFTSRCAKGRKMPLDSIKSIAQGRVWAGVNAKQLGLIDDFGNLQDAIKWVAAKAKISDFKTEAYPEMENPLMKYFNNYMSMKMNDMVKSETGELYKYHDVIKQLTQRANVQCLMEPVTVQ